MMFVVVVPLFFLRVVNSKDGLFPILLSHSIVSLSLV